MRIKNNFTAILEGTRTVNAVTEKGGDAKLTIKVTKCTKDGADLVSAGSTIVAENVDGKTEFKIDGTDATDEMKPVLAELVDTAKPDEPTADEEMGTDKPQKVGDHLGGKDRCACQGNQRWTDSIDRRPDQSRVKADRCVNRGWQTDRNHQEHHHRRCPGEGSQ